MRLALLCLVLGAGTLGCSQSSEPLQKVDVAAQVAGLKGNDDAKTAALTELAAGGKNSAAAVDEIIPLLKSEDPVIRRLAAYALGQIGPSAKAALPALTALMQDSDRNAVTAALNAIRAIDTSKASVEAPPNTMN